MRRRHGRVPRLRAVQAHDARGRRARAGLPARRPRGRRASALTRCWPRRGFLAAARAVRRPTSCWRTFLDATWWYMLDEEIELDARDRDAGDDRDVRPALAATSARCATRRCRADHLFGRRVEMLTLAVLWQLRATRQLAPDRARVDVRRRAGDRARPRRGGVLRARRGVSRRRRLGRAGPRRARRCAVVVAALTVSRSPRAGRGRRVDGPGAWAPLLFVVIARRRLTVAIFPGPLLAAASGLLFGTARARRSRSRRRTLAARHAFSISRRSAAARASTSCRARACAPCRTGSTRGGFLAVLYARIVPASPFSARQLRVPG